MKTKEALKIYKQHQEKMNAYGMMASTFSYDKETIAPAKGNAARNKAYSIIAGDMFVIETDPKYIEAVKQLSNKDLGIEMNREIYLAKKSLEDIIKFSKEEQMEYALAVENSNDAWQLAKRTNNYKKFEPHLLKLIELTKTRTTKRNPQIPNYDLLLDDFEEGMNCAKYDKFFMLIKKELLPLIQKINKNQDKVDASFLYKYYPREKQEIFIKELIKFLRFNCGWSYMGVSEHPFTDCFSENDVRITTSYDEHNITSCIFSVIHEVGHAYYMHQVKHKYQGTMIGNAISSGLHESQSRFLENYLGRRKSFWVTLYPKLQKVFPENLGNISLDDFIKAINESKSSLIRTDADELTYPIHILIRYEIEKGIFEGKINTNNLNKVWNQKYKEYLGINVPNDAVGILQDIHWSGAAFGYFPTYALGSAIGAQLLNYINKQIDIDQKLAKGDFKAIEDYLKENIHQYGALYNCETIVKNLTKEDFNPKYYIDYLKKKYKEIYKIK